MENENITEPQANEPKTYSQEEYDAQLAAGKNEVYAAFGVTAENAESEINAYKAWKAAQEQAPAEKSKSKPENELETVKNQVTALTRRLSAVNAGIPAGKAERYVKLAASYMDDKTDFDAALKFALADFPLSTAVKDKSKQFGGSVSGGAADTLPDEEKIKKIFAQKG